MAYNNNASNKILYPRTFYALYIGLNDSGTGHLIFKLSIKQILTTPKCKPVPMLEYLIKTINKIATFTNKIQVDHFDHDQHIAQQDLFGNNQDDNQEHYASTENSEHESDGELDNSQQIDGMNSDTCHKIPSKE